MYSSTAVGSACATEAKHAVVIGGGVGGLAAAGRLAKAGLAVTLLEKNADVSQAAAVAFCSDGSVILPVACEAVRFSLGFDGSEI